MWQDPIFSNYSVPNPETGYPGGIFDPFGFSKVRIHTSRNPTQRLDCLARGLSKSVQLVRLSCV